VLYFLGLSFIELDEHLDVGHLMLRDEGMQFFTLVFSDAFHEGRWLEGGALLGKDLAAVHVEAGSFD
jgi:hypothetical protein